MTTQKGHARTAVPRRTAGPSRLRIEEIIIPGNARAHDAASVRMMADSIAEVGLVQPVPVTPGKQLLDGVLRLGAATLLGWEEIEVRVLDLDELRSELAGIDANLIRVELTELERAECLLRRKVVYETLHPEVRYGSSEMMQAVRRAEKDAARPPSFADDSACRMGCDTRTVQHLVGIAGGLPQDVRDLIRATPVADIQSDLHKLSRCPEGEQRKIAGRLATGELTRVPKDAGRAPSWTPPEPGDVLRRVERILTNRLSGQPDADLSVIPTALQDIELTRSMWEPPTDEPGELPSNLSLDEIDGLPAGQLEIRWPSRHAVQIVKADVPIAHVAVRRASHSDDSFVKPAGNTKTRDWMGILSSCSHGCCRRAVGFPGTDQACYCDTKGRGGCYVDGFACKKRAEFVDSQVIENGISNSILRITLPEDGNPCLDGHIPTDRVGDIMAWRVDCESSTGDLSISLGLLQGWCESNPTHRFATICANHFQPSDAMMAWLAALDNVVVGHSVSAWFSAEELEARFDAIQRFLDWGIPTVIWVVTDSDWANEPVLERAIGLVGADRVIQEPHRLSANRQRPPLPNTEHLGLCSSHRVDADHNELVLVPGDDGQPGEYLVPLPDGGYAKPRGTVHARCRGCEVRCGLTVHGMMERRGTAEPTLGELRRVIHTPFPSPDRQSFDVIQGDAREVVGSLKQVHCVLTSPPAYGVGAPNGSPLEIGHEADARDYIETLCQVLGAVPLHPLGSLWVNLNDRRDGRVLLGIPERFIVEMVAQGWQLLDHAIWGQSALLADGTTRGGLAEQARWRLSDGGFGHLLRFSRTAHPWGDGSAVGIPGPKGKGERYLPPERMTLPTVLDGRGPSNLWLFGPALGWPGLVAPTPVTVCEIPIALTCPLWVNPDGSLPWRLGPVAGPSGVERADWPNIDEKAQPGVVFDPFCGVGTTGVVALRLGRSFLGCELDEQLCQSARKTLGSTLRRLSGDECVTDSTTFPAEMPLDQPHTLIECGSGVS